MNMRPIDNLQCLLSGGSPQWIPFSLDVGAIPGFSAPIQRIFYEKTGSQSPAEYFGTDVRLFSLVSEFGGEDPAAMYESIEPGTTFDEWGIGHLAGSEGTIDQMFPPLGRAVSIRDVEALPTPRIRSDIDTRLVDHYHIAGYPVFGYGGSIYEWSWWLRGMENFLADLLSEPTLAEAIIRRVEEYTTRLASETARLGVDVVCFYDDAGMQSGLQVSPQVWRRFVKPAWQRVLAAVRTHSPDTKFFFHCCGKIEQIVPDIIECGFHVLHPVQPECMSFEENYRQYGRDIVITATLSSQRLLPFGTPADVREEVRRIVPLAADRRTMLMPSNVIQPETPWENLLAFADAMRELRLS
jgi:uroporphyrinogen decarboxylase